MTEFILLRSSGCSNSHAIGNRADQRGACSHLFSAFRCLQLQLFFF